MQLRTRRANPSVPQEPARGVGRSSRPLLRAARSQNRQAAPGRASASYPGATGRVSALVGGASVRPAAPVRPTEPCPCPPSGRFLSFAPPFLLRSLFAVSSARAPAPAPAPTFLPNSSSPFSRLPPSLDVSSESSLTPFPLHLTWGLRVRAAPERSSAGRRPPSLPIPPRAPRPAPRTAARPAWEPPCGAGARLPRPNGLRGRCPAPPALGASGCGQLLQPKGGFLLENRVHGTRAAHFAKNARTRRDLDALALREAKPKKREKNCGCSVACALPAPLCLPPSF